MTTIFELENVLMGAAAALRDWELDRPDEFNNSVARLGMATFKLFQDWSYNEFMQEMGEFIRTEDIDLFMALLVRDAGQEGGELKLTEAAVQYLMTFPGTENAALGKNAAGE